MRLIITLSMLVFSISAFAKPIFYKNIPWETSKENFFQLSKLPSMGCSINETYTKRLVLCESPFHQKVSTFFYMGYAKL